MTSPARRRIFFFLLALPAVAIVSIIALTARDIVIVNSANPAMIYDGLQEHLATKEPISFPPPDQIADRHPSEKTVFLFGESSLVLSDSDRTFPDYLQAKHPDLRVVNFGYSGIDSTSIRQRAIEAFSLARPDVVVLYYGHNDYNNAYQGYILPEHFEVFSALLRLSYLFYDKTRPVSAFSSGEFYWFSRLNRPALLQLFGNLGLIHVDHTAYARINQLILDYYIRNTEEIIALAVERRVPVVLITPVGNLRAVPYGDRATADLYHKGMASTSYHESLRLLKQARDSELFTYDLRAKSGINEYIRSMRRPSVHVLDLEARLEEMRFSFGYEDFLDYFHFKDRSHKLLADMIYDFMQQKGLTGKGTNRRR